MADLWLPGFSHRPLKTGAAYDDTRTPKLGWHTWEGMSWSAAETAFRSYPPHIGCKPPHRGVPLSEVGKRQYVPLNRHAYSFAGSENDDEYIIQVEVAGRAAEAHDWTDSVCEWLYEEIVEPLEKAVGIPRIVVPGGFFDQSNYRPKVATNYLGSSKSEIRLTADELRKFSGHLGHQHMPPPDQHWDPGRFPIQRILAHSQGDDPLMAAADDILAKLEAVETKVEQTFNQINARTGLLYNALVALGAKVEDVDEADIAQLVIAGLSPTAIAAAIPTDLKQAVKDALREGTG